MMIETPRRQTPTAKEIKVRLPARLHLALRTRKVLHGTPIHEIVVEALDAYFATQPHR